MRYVAFLRGINVGGRKRIKNDELSSIFGRMGFQQVRTLIQSGNVLFDADAHDEDTLTRTVEAGLESALGYPVRVMIRSLPGVQRMLDGDPFKGIKVTKETRLYVTLLAERTDSTLPLPYSSPDGNFRILSRTDREVYSVLTVTQNGRTVDLMSVVEKEFGKRSTTRNWNTIQKVVAL